MIEESNNRSRAGQNPFPDDSPVLVWFPLPDANSHDRSSWSWLPGSILSQCGPDEWHVVVEVPALAEPDPSIPNGDAPENLVYPACFRDATELRAVHRLVRPAEQRVGQRLGSRWARSAAAWPAPATACGPAARLRDEREAGTGREPI
jgi:hypothetical protein